MSEHHLKDRPPVPSGVQAAIQSGAVTGAGILGEAAPSVHLTLAARIAQRGRLRAERAARLARLRPEAPAEVGREVRAGVGTAPETVPEPGPARAAAPETTSGATSGTPPEPIPARRGPSDAQLALEEFLRALTGAETPATPRATRASRGAAEVLPFQRLGETPRQPAAVPTEAAQTEAVEAAAAAAEIPAAEPAAAPACDLDRLPGAGPGLVWALRRAGLRNLAEVAELDEAALATRLGPLGRLLPAATWIAIARAGSTLA